jgi:hypothetical protein
MYRVIVNAEPVGHVATLQRMVVDGRMAMIVFSFIRN